MKRSVWTSAGVIALALALVGWWLLYPAGYRATVRLEIAEKPIVPMGGAAGCTLVHRDDGTTVAVIQSQLIRERVMNSLSPREMVLIVAPASSGSPRIAPLPRVSAEVIPGARLIFAVSCVADRPEVAQLVAERSVDEYIRHNRDLVDASRQEWARQLPEPERTQGEPPIGAKSALDEPPPFRVLESSVAAVNRAWRIREALRK